MQLDRGIAEKREIVVRRRNRFLNKFCIILLPSIFYFVWIVSLKCTKFVTCHNKLLNKLSIRLISTFNYTKICISLDHILCCVLLLYLFAVQDIENKWKKGEHFQFTLRFYVVVFFQLKIPFENCISCTRTEVFTIK